MIYTAQMEVETTAFDAADADLRTLVEVLGGYFEQAAVHNYGSGYRSGDYTVRIPADQYHPFLERVGTLCHVTYQEESSENVSEAYYDAESRLVTQQTKLERLQNLLAQAENMEDIITIESAISDTELEIEQLTGTLRQYDSLVDFSTVYITLQEVYQLSNVEEPATSFGSRMGAAFASGWRGFVSALESVAVALAYGWVWLVLLAAIGGRGGPDPLEAAPSQSEAGGEARNAGRREQEARNLKSEELRVESGVMVSSGAGRIRIGCAASSGTRQFLIPHS